MAARPATTSAALALAVVAVVVTMLCAVERAEAGQNCICECAKLCARTTIPPADRCDGKCKEKACTRSCEEACAQMGFPKMPNEGIAACETEPLNAGKLH